MMFVALERGISFERGEVYWNQSDETAESQ